MERADLLLRRLPGHGVLWHALDEGPRRVQDQALHLHVQPLPMHSELVVRLRNVLRGVLQSDLHGRVGKCQCARRTLIPHRLPHLGALQQQVRGAAGHRLDDPAQEEQPGVLPALLPPRAAHLGVVSCLQSRDWR